MYIEYMEKYYENITSEKKLTALLIAVNDNSISDFAYMIDEMKRLVEACDMDVKDVVVQELANPNPGTYVGTGKLEEIKILAEALEVDYCIVADNLSPAQLKNITDTVDTAVLDRTGLILEIFARRAKTREARLQVESANLQYLLPRLVGMRKSLGRQAGASGSLSNKGQGEKQLELDRRHIERRITEVRRELDSINHDRDVQRALRQKNQIPCVSLVGYTNAGKSTLMNHLLSSQNADDEKKVFEKDMLFATLDTTTRRIDCPDNKSFLLSDTVGFVSNLPHGLVKAFRTTLSEACLADLLLIVVDSSDPYLKEQLEVTENTLKELGCGDIDRIYVYNKCDRLEIIPSIAPYNETRVYISAKNGFGIDKLMSEIKKSLFKNNRVVEITIPYTEGSLIDLLNREATVLETDYREDGIYVKADISRKILGLLDLKGLIK